MNHPDTGVLLKFLNHLPHFSLQRSANHPCICIYGRKSRNTSGVFLPWCSPVKNKAVHLSLLNSASPFPLFAGGTDIISCFMGQNFSVPVYRGEIQARNLGMAVEAWNEEGDGFANCLSFCFWA